jgi:hypothetical protein
VVVVLDAALGVLRFRVFVSGEAATVDSFVRGMGPPVDRWATRLPAMDEGFRPRRPKSYSRARKT